jgi:exopolyphosphatase/pppGpp-phosphohydrolase
MPSSSLFDAALGQQFAELRAQLSAPERVTLLHIGEQSSAILSGHDARSDLGLTLAVGARRTAQTFFRHDPPTGLELENAIAEVEDHVMRARSLPSAGAALACSHPSLRLFAQAAGLDGTSARVLSLEVVEALFQRLASAALGLPSAMRGMPTGPEAAAVLLIIREVMQHLGYESIAIVDTHVGHAGLTTSPT